MLTKLISKAKMVVSILLLAAWFIVLISAIFSCSIGVIIGFYLIVVAALSIALFTIIVSMYHGFTLMKGL